MPVSVSYLNLVFPCARKSVYVLSEERPTKLTSQNRRVFSQAVFSWELKQGVSGFSVLFLPQVLKILGYTSGCNPERGLSQ